jgi:predicted hydrocarbon binding protein
MKNFEYEDMKSIDRSILGDSVPLELFRAVRLIGMYQGLPMGGRGTTLTVGRKIGESLPVKTVDELLNMFKDLKIGIPSITQSNERGMNIVVDDCFCKGLPVDDEKMVCDLEGAIMEGALRKILNRNVAVREVKCNVHGDDHCEYEIRLK